MTRAAGSDAAEGGQQVNVAGDVISSLNANPVDVAQAKASGIYPAPSSTGAVFWGGGCGVVGCNSTYLVTTVYSTLEANTRSRIVAGIVTKSPGKGFRVSRILTKAGIECLFNPK
jgi:hypothetical protein